MKIGAKKLALAILCCTCLSAPAQAGNFYGFGDSLVDNGNIPKLTGIDYPPPPYSENRFSNGDVWAQYFPGLTGLGFAASNDYGVGGAFAGPLSVDGATYNNLENLPVSLGEPGFTTPLPSFLSEVQEFAATGAHFGSSDVVGVWVGANDYFATLDEVDAGLVNPNTAIPAAIGLVATQTATGVAELDTLGARRFIVFTLPALGETPLFNSSGAATIALADEISSGHDLALSYAMAETHAATGANIIVINQAQLFSELLADPAAYGKTNTIAACISTPSCVTAPTAVQNQYVFWDSVHPTTGTHLIIAAYAANALNGLGGLAASAQIGAAGADAFTTQLDTRTAALAAGAPGFSVDLPGQGAGQLANPGKLSGFSPAPMISARTRPSAPITASLTISPASPSGSMTRSPPGSRPAAPSATATTTAISRRMGASRPTPSSSVAMSASISRPIISMSISPTGSMRTQPRALALSPAPSPGTPTATPSASAGRPATC